MGGQHLNAPMVGMAATPHHGYWEVASDGGIFDFGGAYVLLRVHRQHPSQRAGRRDGGHA